MEKLIEYYKRLEKIINQCYNYETHKNYINNKVSISANIDNVALTIDDLHEYILDKNIKDEFSNNFANSLQDTLELIQFNNYNYKLIENGFISEKEKMIKQFFKITKNCQNDLMENNPYSEDSEDFFWFPNSEEQSGLVFFDLNNQCHHYTNEKQYFHTSIMIILNCGFNFAKIQNYKNLNEVVINAFLEGEYEKFSINEYSLLKKMASQKIIENNEIPMLALTRGMIIGKKYSNKIKKFRLKIEQIKNKILL